MKIIFAGTPDISAAVLQALINKQHNIIACLTQPDRPQGRGLKITASPVKNVALNANIPILQPQTLKDKDVQEQLQSLQPDLMIVIAYGLILPQAILDIPKYGCINIHASILPRWRGAAPIQHAILAGDKTTGITIMQMDAGLDTGDILEIYPCDISTNETSASLYEKLTLLAQTAIVDCIIKLSQHTLKPVKQDNNLATYAHKIEKQQAKIDWHNSAVQIVRCVNAYNPWPVAFTTFDNQNIRIWNAESADITTSDTPGKIIALETNGIIVATGNGTIRLLTLQLPGKKMLSVSEICHAHHELNIGAQFI